MEEKHREPSQAAAAVAVSLGPVRRGREQTGEKKGSRKRRDVDGWASPVSQKEEEEKEKKKSSRAAFGPVSQKPEPACEPLPEPTHQSKPSQVGLPSRPNAPSGPIAL